MTSATVLSLASNMEAIVSRRIARIVATVEQALHIPLHLGVEEGTGDLVATPQEWAFFEEIFEAFFMELPRDVKAQAAIGGVVYLAGRLGSNIKLRAEHERTYRRVQELLTPAEQAFIDAVFGDELSLPGKLIKELDALSKKPSDFA